MRDDIFDMFYKRFKKLFEEWTAIEDELFGDFEESFDIKIPKGAKGKSYSISYHYETGMDRPEIKVEGDATEEDIRRFLDMVQKRFGHHILGLSEKVPLKLGSGEVTINDPDIDVIEHDDSNIYTMEMPGIGKEHIKVTKKDKSLHIVAQNGDRKYEKVIHLGFKPGNVKITANNGIISIEVEKPKKEDKG